MIIYLIKSTCLLVAFYLFYVLVLQKETMFKFNRYYLLFAVGLSFVIPLLSIPVSTTHLPTAILDTIVFQKAPNMSFASGFQFDTRQFFCLVYVVGFIYFGIRFVSNLLKITKTIANNEVVKKKNTNFVLVEDQVVPHTFLNFIFVHKDDFLQNIIPAAIIVHEKTHANQLHSIDVLLVELLKIIFWFNPLIFFYKNAIQLNHEFLADQNALTYQDTISTYQKILLEFVNQNSLYALASNFNFSITKKRFIMMTRKSNPTSELIKKLLIVPLFFIAVAVFSNQSFAQTKPVLAEMGKDGIKPDFPGGIREFYKYFMKNFKIPSSVGSVNGKIQATFIVEKDGSLSEIKVLKTPSDKLNVSVIETLKNCPKWIAGKKNGVPVRVQYNLPISIALN
ncbi:MAG: hypothetical protein RLZZ312_624 [Bacteroidota bacterium]